MAYTVTLRKKGVHGDQRYLQYLVTADAATQSVATGLSYIDVLNISPGSLTTYTFKAWANSNASGVATNGTVGLSGLTSGDQFYMTVYGH